MANYVAGQVVSDPDAMDSSIGVEFDAERNEIVAYINEEEIMRIIRGEAGWKLVFETMRFWSLYLAKEARIVETTATLATGQEDTSRVRMIVWFDN